MEEETAMLAAHSVVGLPKNRLDTPALCVDLDVMEGNIARIATACRERGVAWRPHTKGQKVPAIAHKLLAAGAIGVTCQKLGEAEIMAAAGIRDILVANQIVGDQKIARLVNLLRHADVVVAVDHPDNVAALDAAARAKGVCLRVVIEVNIGGNRAGVEPGGAVATLARRIAEHPGLRFTGVMGWESHTTAIQDQSEKARAVAAAVELLTLSADACRSAGLRVDIVSCGGTGTYRFTTAQPGVTEIQAGGGIFSDVRYRTKFLVDHPYALTVMTTVTSRPNPRRIICDAGKKAMSSDAAVPSPLGVENVESVNLSAEHARIELTEPDSRLRVGDRVEFVVGYGDTTVHLHEEIYGIRDGAVEIVWPVLGRGRMR
jgi:D-serine deaminase-like pyridoxal phosphate-dependent protein